MPGRKDGDPYLLRLKRMPLALRIVYGRPRTFICLAIGLASLAVLPHGWRTATRLLVAWDIFAALYVVSAFAAIFRTASRCALPDFTPASSALQT